MSTPVFLRRLGPDPHANGAQTPSLQGCPDIFELADGELISKGLHTPKLFAKSSCGTVFTICATRDGSTIFFAGVGGKVFTVHFASGAVSELVQHGEATIFSMVYDELRGKLFCGSADGAIGFTGRRIVKTDANTQADFGDYFSIYDIQCAVDGHLHLYQAIFA